MADISEMTQEQLDALESKVVEAEKELNELRPLKDSSEKLKQEFSNKEKAWLEEKKLLEESSNPNWPKTREIIKNLKEVAKSKGIEVDDDGNIKSNPLNVDIAQIRREAADAAKQELINSRVQDRLSQYDDESGKLVDYFYKKLTVGETLTLQNINKFIDQAHRAAELEAGNPINVISGAAQYSGGQGPRGRSETEGKLDEVTAKELATRMGLKIGDEQK